MCPFIRLFHVEAKKRLTIGGTFKNNSYLCTIKYIQNCHNMFSKELESLIQATLEDGVMEEHEKAAIVRRAQNEGVDLAELDIYINSLLQKRARELEYEKIAALQQAEKAKKESFGRKCPNCGAQVPPLTLKCVCGYEFTATKSVSSVQMLSEKINNIMLSEKNEQRRYELIRETISIFPVPNTKEDIIEFLALSAPNAKKKGGLLGSKVGRILIVAIIIVVLVVIMSYFASPSSSHRSRFSTTAFGQGLFIFGFFGALAFGGIAKYILGHPDSTIIHNESATVWRTKFDQVMMKGRSLQGDANFQRQLDYYENIMK